MRRFNIHIRPIIILGIMFVCTVYLASASGPVPYLDWSYPDQSTVATYVNETIYYVDMELDDSGIAHIIFLKDFEDRYAYYITHKDPGSGNFTEPVRVYSTPEDASLVTTDGEYIVTELDHEANWHILFVYDDGNSNKSRLNYVYIVDGVVQDEQIVIERNSIVGICDMAVDDQCHPHVVLITRLPDDSSDYHLYYFRKENEHFTEIIREKFGDYMHPGVKMHLETEGSLFIIFNSDGNYLLIELYDDEISFISQPIEEVHDIHNFENCRITMDPEGKLHIFLRTFDLSWHNWRQLHFVSDDRGRTFSDPVLVSELSFEFRLAGDPIILSDGSIILGHSRYLWSAPNSFLDGFVQIDRGYGFGNSDYMHDWGVQNFYHESLTYPTIQVTDDYHLLAATVFSGYEQSDLKTTIIFFDYSLIDYETPHIKITVPYTRFDNMLFGEDQIRVCLDIYNPLDTPVEVEMAIGTELSCLPGYFFFISDRDGFPTYELEYTSFPMTLPPDTYYQNIPMIRTPGIDLVPLSESYSWFWYAILLDSKTGELLDYSHDSCGYNRWDDVPDY